MLIYKRVNAILIPVTFPNLLPNIYLYIVSFNFLNWAVQQFHFGVPPPGKPSNLFGLIVSQTSFYIVSFNFICSTVQ